MDKNIKYINQDIRSGKNQEENIPKIFHYLMNHYHTLAAVKLSMQYYSFYEAFCDDESTWGNDSKAIISEMNESIRDAILKNKYGSELEDTVKAVDVLRSKIIKKMKVLTIYTDIFLIYEYVLNRVEYRFKEDTMVVEDEEFEKEVLRYIFDSKDNFIINEKIKEIIAQLPIRMTKQKFFDLLKTSLHVYLGADGSSLDSYLYILRTSGLLLNENDMQSNYPILWENKEYLSNLKYKDITREEYEQASCTLKVASLILETETTIYLNLQEMINEIYTLLLCTSYAGMAYFEMQSQEDAAISIISKINQLFIQNQKEELPIELMKQFSEIEGVQENISEEITILEDSLYVIDKDYRKICESLMIDKQLNVLLHSNKLLSNSLFIDLSESAGNEKVMEERLSVETSRLIEELSASFAENDKVVNKAVMANILNKMPVFFQSHNEVMEYVRHSIDQCADKNEKSASIHIIGNIIKE